ncbi:MAG TPA: sulfotransferase [Woeseiaceae bacterium]|nr:sulfotransferase [Woeseiaceae bacterium]
MNGQSIESISGRARKLVEQGQFAHAAELVRREIGGAELDARHTEALYVLAVASRHGNDYPGALDTLRSLQSVNPAYARGWQEQGHALFSLNRLEDARRAYERAVQLNEALPASWKALANLYRLAGLERHADWALSQVEYLESLPEELRAVASMTQEGDLERADALCRRFLQQHKHHPEGMRLLAAIAERLEISGDAEFLLESCVELAPELDRGRSDYVNFLLKMQKFEKAHRQAEILLARDPENPEYQSMLASATAGIGRHERAIEMFDRVLASSRRQNSLYVMRGHAQKTIGRLDEAIASYRKACEIQPDYGDAFWSLANTKTYRFTDAEIAHMQQYEAAAATGAEDRIHLCFALGKAFEDREEYADSFTWYEKGNELQHRTIRHQASHLAIRTAAQIETCTEVFFEQLEGSGHPAPDPIFIVGLPRAGSTLLEQILASHTQVDGTLELPNIIALAQRLRGGRNLVGANGKPSYPAVLAEIDRDYLRRFGEQFIEDTRVYRRGAPFFIDKNPNNFFHIGLIRAILPNAKVIDARRHPMACCFSGFKQLFGQGQEFSYGLAEIGNYYREYVQLMAHWDRVLPGFVLRVRHEDVVDDLEGQVRRLLEFCGLPFEARCVEFHKTGRSVRTPSSEQVRQPIYRSGLEQWRHYEPWLGPLKEALGPEILAKYGVMRDA